MSASNMKYKCDVFVIGYVNSDIQKVTVNASCSWIDEASVATNMIS